MNDFEMEQEEVEDEGGEKKVKMKKYHCDSCDLAFHYPSKLRSHIANSHPTKMRYECDIDECRAKFLTFLEMRKHKKLMHPIRHSCPDCSYENEKKVFVLRHFAANHQNGVMCTVAGCGVKFAKNRLKIHLEEAHGVKSRKTVEIGKLKTPKCTECGYKPDLKNHDFNAQLKEVQFHVDTVHRNKPVACVLGCGEKVTMDNMMDHFRTVHGEMVADEREDVNGSDGEKEQSVSMTGGTGEEDEEEEEEDNESTKVMSEDDLEENEEVDEVEEEEEEVPKKKRRKMEETQGRFECMECGRRFMESEYLRKHKKYVHTKEYTNRKRERKHKCDWKYENGTECGKVYTSKSTLADHINLHNGNQPYICHTCNQRFHARARFAVHLKKYHRVSIKTYAFMENNFNIGSFNDNDSDDIRQLLNDLIEKTVENEGLLT